MPSKKQDPQVHPQQLLYTIPQAAIVLGLPNTDGKAWAVRKLIRENRLRFIVTGAGHMVPRKAIEEFIEKGMGSYSEHQARNQEAA
jgi:excisionase family DNA binding protein